MLTTHSILVLQACLQPDFAVFKDTSPFLPAGHGWCCWDLLSTRECGSSDSYACGSPEQAQVHLLGDGPIVSHLQQHSANLSRVAQLMASDTWSSLSSASHWPTVGRWTPQDGLHPGNG